MLGKRAAPWPIYFPARCSPGLGIWRSKSMRALEKPALAKAKLRFVSSATEAESCRRAGARAWGAVAVLCAFLPVTTRIVRCNTLHIAASNHASKTGLHDLPDKPKAAAYVTPIAESGTYDTCLHYARTKLGRTDRSFYSSSGEQNGRRPASPDISDESLPVYSRSKAWRRTIQSDRCHSRQTRGTWAREKCYTERLSFEEKRYTSKGSSGTIGRSY